MMELKDVNRMWACNTGHWLTAQEYEEVSGGVFDSAFISTLPADLADKMMKQPLEEGECGWCREKGGGCGWWIREGETR